MCNSLLFDSLLKVADSRLQNGPRKYVRFNSALGRFSAEEMSRIDRVKRFFGFSEFAPKRLAEAIVKHLGGEEARGAEETIRAQRVANKIFYLAGSKPSDLFKGKNAHWMRDLPEEIKARRLHQLLLPATHNSGAYKVDYTSSFEMKSKLYRSLNWVCRHIKILGKFIAGWTKTQHYSIQEQLAIGVRSFDFRVSYSKGQFYLTHTFNCSPLGQALEEIRLFMENHPEEVLIIRSKPDWEHREGMEGDASKRYAELVLAHLGNLLCPPKESFDASMTLLQMAQSGQRIVFCHENFFWDKTLFPDQWDDTSDLKEKQKALEASITAYKAQKDSANALLFTLTPQKKDIALGLFRSKNSLEKMNLSIQKVIPSYLDRLENVTEAVGDFITPDIASQIIRSQPHFRE